MGIINLADRQEGFGSFLLGSKVPSIDGKGVTAEVLSPCSELLQRVPWEENSNTAQGPRGTGLVREGGNTVQIPKTPRKQVLRAKRGVESKSRHRDRKRNLKQYFLSYSWLCFWLCFQACDF